MYVEEGADIRLSCSVNYQPSGSPVILWKKDPTLLNYEQRVTVRTERVSGDSSVLSHLVIREARIGDSGNYSCHMPTLPGAPARTTIHVIRTNSAISANNNQYQYSKNYLLILLQVDPSRRYTVINIIIFFLFHSNLLPLLLFVQLLKTFPDVT